MIKVLHIINGAGVGGISATILNFYKGIDMEKIHFDFVSANPVLGENGKTLELLGSHFFFINKKSDGLIRHIRELNCLLHNNHYDVIHVHQGNTSYIDLAVAKKIGIKIRIAHGHNAIKERLSVKEWLSRIIGIALIKCFSTKRIACSEDAAIYTFGKHSLSEKNLIILPNAIDRRIYKFDSDKRKKYRKEFQIKEHEFVVGTVGRMSREKNQIKLVDSFYELSKNYSQARLILIGDGDDRSFLEKRCEKLGMTEKVIFTGNRFDVSGILSCLDTFVLPSIYEGFPIAGLEALSCGLPVVLSDTITKRFEVFKVAKYISLEKTDREWADVILKTKNTERLNDTTIEELFRDNLYDIGSAAAYMERIYANQI